jgi:hypothetical protein
MKILRKAEVDSNSKCKVQCYDDGRIIPCSKWSRNLWATKVKRLGSSIGDELCEKQDPYTMELSLLKRSMSQAYYNNYAGMFRLC